LGTGIAAIDAHLSARDLDNVRRNRGLTEDQRDAFNRRLAQRDRRMTATYLIGGFATALAVAGGLVYYFDTPDIPQALTPTISPRGVGVQGHF
jgi:hypothetical protein